MNKSKKTTITKNEYLQLVGLQALANSYLKKIDDLESLAYELTGELDSFGFTTDMICNDRGIDEVLEQLDITIKE